MSARKLNAPVCCPACQHVFDIGLAERFWAKVDRDASNGCWLWTGCTQTDGRYGVIHSEGRNVGVHRVVLTLAGRDPGELHVDHLCRNTLCVNPDHLEAVTAAENTRRAHSFQTATHCKHGHEFTPENTYIWPLRGSRHCRECNRIQARAYIAQKRARA